MKPKNNRNLYTGDCSYIFTDIYNPGNGPFTAKVFHDHVDLLAASGVTTFLVNPNGQKPWYPSKVASPIFEGYTRGDKEYFRGQLEGHMEYNPDFSEEDIESWFKNQTDFADTFLDVLEADIDWVEEMSKTCRRNNISPWLTIRMNDVHGVVSREGSFMNCELFKDLKNCLSGVAPNPADGIITSWRAMSYECEPVRQRMYLIIKELIENYDYEGMEFDWLRFPHLCEPNASQEVIDMMTEWIASIRSLTNAKAKETGKPYPLGFRMPASLGLLRSIGLDVKAIVEAELIDFISPSNFWQTSWNMPYDQLRATLGDKVTIYGVIEDAPNWLPCTSEKYHLTGMRLLSACAELLRGNAAGKLALGTDGIETFNFFCTDQIRPQFERTLSEDNAARPDFIGGSVSRDSSKTAEPLGDTGKADYAALKNLEDLEFLRGKPKQYAFSSTAIKGGTWYPTYELPEEVPVIIEPMYRRLFKLSMCAEPPDTDMELIIQIVLERGDNPPDIGVGFNGLWPNFKAEETKELLFPAGVHTHHIDEYIALNFRMDIATIKEGWNEILVTNNSFFYRRCKTGEETTPQERAEYSVRVVSVEVAVK